MWCRSRRFDCILLVFFEWLGRLVMRDLIKHNARLHPNKINRDTGIEIWEAWVPTIKKNTTTGEACDSGPPKEANHWVNSKDRITLVRAVEKQLITAENNWAKWTISLIGSTAKTAQSSSMGRSSSHAQISLFASIEKQWITSLISSTSQPGQSKWLAWFNSQTEVTWEKLHNLSQRVKVL